MRKRRPLSRLKPPPPWSNFSINHGLFRWSPLHSREFEISSPPLPAPSPSLNPLNLLRLHPVLRCLSPLPLPSSLPLQLPHRFLLLPCKPLRPFKLPFLPLLRPPRHPLPPVNRLLHFTPRHQRLLPQSPNHLPRRLLPLPHPRLNQFPRPSVFLLPHPLRPLPSPWLLFLRHLPSRKVPGKPSTPSSVSPVFNDWAIAMAW